eukprot:1158286-Pelagomonas_calceolata.AAC.3
MGAGATEGLHEPLPVRNLISKGVRTKLEQGRRKAYMSRFLCALSDQRLLNAGLHTGIVANIDTLRLQVLTMFTNNSDASTSLEPASSWQALTSQLPLSPYGLNWTGSKTLLLSRDCTRTDTTHTGFSESRGGAPVGGPGDELHAQDPAHLAGVCAYRKLLPSIAGPGLPKPLAFC